MHTSYKVDQTIKKITISSMLVVLYVIINRFIAINISAFGTPAFIRITVSTIVLIIASIIMGPVYGLCVGIVSDIVSAVVFPIGAFFPGYTLTYAMAGFIPGIIFYLSKKFNISDKIFFILNVTIESILHFGAIIYLLIHHSIPVTSQKVFTLKTPLLVIIILLLLISFIIITIVGYRQQKEKKSKSFYSVSKIWFSYVMIEIVCFFFLNSFWSTILVGAPFSILFVLKIAKSFFTIPIHVIIVMPLVRVLEKRGVIQSFPAKEKEQKNAKNIRKQ